MTRKAQPLRIVPREGDVYEHRHDGKLYRFVVRKVVDGGGLVDGCVEYDRYVRAAGRKREWERGRALKMLLSDWRKQARKALKEKPE